MPADGQDIDQWKQKYYDQLDVLEQREQDWEALETTLKRAVSRLSLAAEGQNKTLDRHLVSLRGSIKNQINQAQLDSIINDISNILSKLEEKAADDKQLNSNILHQLISQLQLPSESPKAFIKSFKQLEKKLKKADDASQQEGALLKETLDLLQLALTQPDQSGEEKHSLLGRLFNKDEDTKPASLPSDQPAFDITDISNSIYNLLSQIPWPEPVKAAVNNAIDKIPECSEHEQLSLQFQHIASTLDDWPISETQAIDTDANQKLETYRSCLLNILSSVNTDNSPSGKISALTLSASDAENMKSLEDLGVQLSSLILTTNHQGQESASASIDAISSSSGLQPGIQELLIRLLEQLIVPADMQVQADEMKQRLEQDTTPSDWKSLLKDVASLINSIRSHLQKEKYEFETFLQQVTDRLKAMDQFLQTESANIQVAETQGLEFDKQLDTNVNDIRKDINEATQLNDLKQSVNIKLDTIASHILNYRDSEKERLLTSQQQVDLMQSRMQELEKETETLKKEVIEKNRQAMFDTLTGIPNRLSYEKRIEEEVARWKRFSTPLSLAVWDIDFFKKVNDTFGHKAGDKVLRTVAQLLNKRIRQTDFLARYGGEEFVMLLPGTAQEETIQLLNGLREEVQNCGFHYHGDAVTITVSCGISSFSEGDSVNRVFERADQALYKAKENGRNQCVIHTD